MNTEVKLYYKVFLRYTLCCMNFVETKVWMILRTCSFFHFFHLKSYLFRIILFIGWLNIIGPFRYFIFGISICNEYVTIDLIIVQCWLCSVDSIYSNLKLLSHKIHQHLDQILWSISMDSMRLGLNTSAIWNALNIWQMCFGHFKRITSSISSSKL
mgnify:CR=1 FL=1